MMKAIQSVLNIKFFNLEKIEDNSKLLKYRQYMLWIIHLWLLSSISMASGGALGLAFCFHSAELIILLVSVATSLLTFIPFAFFMVWTGEIENILTKRCEKFDGRIDKIIRIGVLKMMFWAILIVLLPMLIRKLTG